MMKKITLSLDEDVFNFLKNNFVNKSAFIRALILKHYTENRINIKEEKCQEDNLN